jgi:hypothetical protein
VRFLFELAGWRVDVGRARVETRDRELVNGRLVEMGTAAHREAVAERDRLAKQARDNRDAELAEMQANVEKAEDAHRQALNKLVDLAVEMKELRDRAPAAVTVN